MPQFMPNSPKAGVRREPMGSLEADIRAASVTESLVSGHDSIEIVVGIVVTQDRCRSAGITEQLSEVIVVGWAVALGLRKSNMDDVHHLCRVDQALQEDCAGGVIEPKVAHHGHVT